MSYTDIAYCDSVLSSAAWVASDDTQKQNAINMGELWIDANYSCAISSPVDDSIQSANALLADMYVNDNLFVPKDAELESKSVTAGSVETSKTYFKGASAPNSFAEIELLLSSACEVNIDSSFRTLRV